MFFISTKCRFTQSAVCQAFLQMPLGIEKVSEIAGRSENFAQQLRLTSYGKPRDLEAKGELFSIYNIVLKTVLQTIDGKEKFTITVGNYNPSGL